MGQIIGYARVSSAGQNLDAQLDALGKAKCDKIYQEKKSGARRHGREELTKMLDFVRDGDTIIITRLDRLARSLADLIAIGKQLETKDVSLNIIEQDVNTSTPAGKLFFHMLGAFSEFENSLRRERQAEGIAAAKARPDSPYRGRPASIDVDKVKGMHVAGMGATAIAKELEISRQSVYRLMK
ncbi:MAG: recombinase family protein [Alphaproteobacteria bacterium]|nr:recombinase family protein [Alphaproteobacteria bacterium]